MARTHDNLIKSEVLYRLSYGPFECERICQIMKKTENFKDLVFLQLRQYSIKIFFLSTFLRRGDFTQSFRVQFLMLANRMVYVELFSDRFFGSFSHFIQLFLIA